MAKSGRKQRSLDERFHEKTIPEPNTGCLLWTGATNNKGYGCIGLGRGKLLLAHRVAWMLHHGAIPDGLVIRHRCDNGSIGCVEVTHLQMGTQRDNVLDSMSRGRNRPPINSRRGEACGSAKLTAAQVMEIRMGRLNGVLIRDLAIEFKVSRSTVGEAARGTTWKHIKESHNG